MTLVFDELNNLQEKIREIFSEENIKKMSPDERVRYCEDSILDMLIYAWTVGEQDFYSEVGVTDFAPNTEALETALAYQIDGKTYADRVREYATSGDITSLNKVAETETTRIYNEAKYVSALTYQPKVYINGNKITKEWVTMGDEKVRDTHAFLDGVKVDLEAEFWSYDGDHALIPGGFTLPQNNINCRCYVVYEIQQRS